MNQLTFTVHGVTLNDLELAAADQLNQFFTGKPIDKAQARFDLDIRPSARAWDGEILSWEADVECCW